MKRLLISAFLPLMLPLAVSGPALADYPRAVEAVILPGYADLAATTLALSEAAALSCDPEALRPAFEAAYDAWMAVSYLQFGPVEDDGIRLAMAYWPDPNGRGAKALRGLLVADPALLTPEAFAEQSVAVRGLAGLERLLYPAKPLAADACPLIKATAADMARMAAEVQADWLDGYAQALLTAGEPGNSLFLSPTEVRQLLFTQIYGGLEFIMKERLGRPLGTFDAPHPERAESVAAGRSLRNIRQSLVAMRDLTQSLTPDAPQTVAAFDHAIALADGLDDPVFAGVASANGHLKVEILQQAVTAVRDIVLTELAPELDVGIGFNAQDGD